jgi:hypothetical protein
MTDATGNLFVSWILCKPPLSKGVGFVLLGAFRATLFREFYMMPVFYEFTPKNWLLLLSIESYMLWIS